MTIEELKKVPFRETCHMAMEGEYTTTYMSKDGRLGFGKVYKSKKKFLEAIKDYNP